MNYVWLLFEVDIETNYVQSTLTSHVHVGGRQTHRHTSVVLFPCRRYAHHQLDGGRAKDELLGLTHLHVTKGLDQGDDLQTLGPGNILDR